MALAGCSEPQRPGARLLARALSAGAGGEAPPSDGAAEKKVRRRQEVGLSEWGDRLRGLLKFVGYYSKESTMIRNSSKLYLNARAVVVDTDFLGQFDLEDSWENEFYVNCLHLWMIFVRIRKEGPGMKQLSQEVFDNFWNDMQQGMFHSLGAKLHVLLGADDKMRDALGEGDPALGVQAHRRQSGLGAVGAHRGGGSDVVPRLELPLLRPRAAVDGVEVVVVRADVHEAIGADRRARRHGGAEPALRAAGHE